MITTTITIGHYYYWYYYFRLFFNGIFFCSPHSDWWCFKRL